MQQKLNNLSGYYMPSFFRLHINTNNSISDIWNLSDYDFSIFFHEYIHFIQDTTSFYGLNNINYTVEYLRYANNKIIKEGNPLFKVPIIPIDNTDNVKLNGYLCKATFGDTENIKKIKSVCSYKIYPVKVPISNSPIEQIELVDINFIDSTGQNESFSFGAGCIIESMAYLLEQLSCNQYASSPDIPYNSAELVAKHIYPEFGNNKLNILALCDISLNISNPAKYFIQSLERYKKDKFLPQSPEDLYADFKTVQFSTYNGYKINFKEYFNSLANAVKQQLKGYFNDPHFDDLNDWIDTTIENIKEYRINKPSFILDFAKGSIKENNSFKEFFYKVGTPLLTNNKKEFRFFHAALYTRKVNIGYFWAISQINNIFWGVQNPCELKELCEVSLKDTSTDRRCDTAPWTRASDTVLCPFAIFWRHWALTNYTPNFE